MKNHVFIYYGAIFIFFNIIGSSILLSTIILLAIYFIMAIYAAVLTFKYKTTNPLILLVLTLYLIVYIFIDWDNTAVVYIPDGMHLIVGFILVIFGVFFAKKFQSE